MIDVFVSLTFETKSNHTRDRPLFTDVLSLKILSHGNLEIYKHWQKSDIMAIYSERKCQGYVGNQA